MNKLIFTLFCILSGLFGICQGSYDVLLHEQFIENQNSAFTKSDRELFVFGETTWIRPYGEKEYALTPRVESVSEYTKRIRKLDNPETGVFKSKMHYLRVNLTPSAKVILSTMSIFVPDYINSNVIVLLPQIDIDKLIKDEIEFELFPTYDAQTKLIEEEIGNERGDRATIWSENWESTGLPDSDYSLYVGSTNCGWEDVSCFSYSGSWSAWCAGAGAACNVDCDDYVNDMDAELSNSSFIDISGYTDIEFSYYMYVDFNNTGTNDVLRRWTDVGAGWTLSVTYDSSSPEDEAGWVSKTGTLSGSPSQFSTLFDFESNWTGTSFGAYLDDLFLNGNSTASINESDVSELSVYPNPNNGQFTLELNDKHTQSNNKVLISDAFGRSLYTESYSPSNDGKIILDLSWLSEGVYNITIQSSNKKTTKRFIID